MMNTRPYEKADQRANEVTVGSVVSRIAERTTVSLNVCSASAVFGFSDWTGYIFERMIAPRLSFMPKKTSGVRAPLMISSIQKILRN